ncbi:MAG: sigma factor, partial [Planctomycetaceae bacterium]
MVRLAYVLTRNAEVSDEIVQEAFLRLHANWNRVDNPAAYLRKAVINGCHSHHRHLR